MFERIFKYHYSQRYAYLLDTLCLGIATELLLYLNSSDLVFTSRKDQILYIALAIICITAFRGYRMLLRFTTVIDIGKITSGLLATLLIYAIYIGASSRATLNYLLLLFYFSLSLLSLYRLVIKIVYARVTKEEQLLNTLLLGAGDNGRRTKRALDDSNAVNVLAFIDDDPAKIGRSIEGISVYALDKNLERLLQKNEVDQVIITTAELSQKRKNEIFQFFKNKGVKIFTVPPIDEWASNQGIQGSLKPIIIEDLLRRDEIQINLDKNRLQYTGKTILVTGAAGSIGSEIVRQLIPFTPHKIILLDQAETPLFDIKNEILKKEVEKIHFEYILQSITDKAALNLLFETHDIDVVFHAAAYKHVFMTEALPHVAVINNILGTKNVVDTALEHQVGHFVMVSTDKAVNPSNVMGASKRIAEIYVALVSEGAKTQFITTRFGNVLGSNGSVVPIFKQQIAGGGPVTITHPEITRYFMTITEACQLVLEAGATGEGGEIYVFDMGEPVKIKDLAVSMIRLSGFIEDQDIALQYSGLRPGEKLFEELLTDKENLKTSYNELIFIAEKETFPSARKKQIEDLIVLAAKQPAPEVLVKEMKILVPEFKSMNSKYETLD